MASPRAPPRPPNPPSPPGERMLALFIEEPELPLRRRTVEGAPTASSSATSAGA